MIQLQSKGIVYPFEIVCPDGLVRHFPYAHRADAESDAAHATSKGCRFFEKPNRLEQAFGECPAGSHTVREREDGGA